MKKLINKPEDVVTEALHGMAEAHADLLRVQFDPNVIVTGHQAFFTREALGTILDTTLRSISDFAAGRPLANEIAASA